ncbi:hypothetical protein [Levilactobacillus parabrevis]|uniref:hypothetical protein n=1 Tax=Levilactobacillus parabrevis TaxID=357278 RepID=UPI0021A53C8D|nr:hypothetical protein [Levilactobacillus parabrevis]MCT4487288.1 hypothetical protein [Levilactobacillus parabrevis]MCT4491460.1 hypothetical protein [Levilactobacillus parabrevis]
MIEQHLMTLDEGWATITHQYSPALFAFADVVIVLVNGRVTTRGRATDPAVMRELNRLQLMSV